MNAFRKLLRPEYVLRPVQLWRRLRKESLLARRQVQLAWGLPVSLDPCSHVGCDIWNIGVNDRIVPEAIVRLLDPGEKAIDVGANFGQCVSIMALAVGPAGMAYAFEPGPESWQFLSTNAESWANYQLSPISLVRKGLSNHVGAAHLNDAIDLGGFSLEDQPPGPERVRRAESSGVDIEITTLDSFFPDNTEISLIKIDVEGHEPQVLEGARRLLESKQIRDIVFEDFYPHPSPTALLLQSAGYTIFSLIPTWRRPLLLDRREHPDRIGSPPNFLATIDPVRARSRFQAAGWKCLSVRARPKR